jgi:hypothetical protein
MGSQVHIQERSGQSKKNNADADPDPQISIHIKWAEVTVE